MIKEDRICGNRNKSIEKSKKKLLVKFLAKSKG